MFGGILIVTAIRMAFFTSEDMDPGQNFIVRGVRRMFPVTDEYHGEHFFVREGLKAAPTGWMLTPLALALVMVETTDLIFAVDSIPAIFAITADPFLVFTSNVFAILGLRSLYFALAGALHALRYMKHALAAVLVTVGVKMLAHKPLEDAARRALQSLSARRRAGDPGGRGRGVAASPHREGDVADLVAGSRPI